MCQPLCTVGPGMLVYYHIRGQFHKTLQSILKSKPTSNLFRLWGFSWFWKLRVMHFFNYQTTKNLISIWSYKITCNFLTWIGLKLILILKLILKFYEIGPRFCFTINHSLKHFTILYINNTKHYHLNNLLLKLCALCHKTDFFFSFFG